MLNLSEQSITLRDLERRGLKSHRTVFKLRLIRRFSNILYIVIGFFFILLFFPWTQNVYMEGHLTTLEPETRPQEVQSVIEGRIDKWFVKEGDFVEQYDTVARIAEIKDVYWDPFILQRTKEQIDAKQQAIHAYENKILAQQRQVDQLRKNLDLSLKQTKNKLIQNRLKLSADSANIVAAQTDYNNFKAQYDRGLELFKQNLISRTELEQRQNRLQGAMARLNKSENDYAITQNEFINTEIELNSLEASYLEKIFKTQSEIQTVVSEISKLNEEMAKLNNLYSSYTIRAGNYYILAPQRGQIVKIYRSGIGENVKAGEALASITPETQRRAIAFYISALDVPLFDKGRKVRVLFDGWPSIVFSGWPGASFGTFGGTVEVIDNNISPNGKFRILVSKDTTDDVPWPTQLPMGSGAKAYALLKDVPIWYEIWRRLNGFPPEFYGEQQTQESAKEKEKEKQ